MSNLTIGKIEDAAEQAASAARAAVVRALMPTNGEEEEEEMEADLAGAISAYHDGQMLDEHIRTLMGYVRKYAGRVAELEGKLAEACKADNQALKIAEQQRDKALADLTAERGLRGFPRVDYDQAQAEITALKIAVHNCKLAQDKAESELKAASESERRFRAEVEAGFRKHGLAAGPTAIDRLVEDLATEREKNATLLNGCHIGVLGLAAELTATSVELAATKARAEKAEAHLAASLATVAPYNDVSMERDAARAEAAQWKERAEKAEALAVTKILLGVVPGDGDGLEVYAKTVEDVENALSSWYEKTDAARAEADAAKAKLRHVCEIMSTLGNPGLNDVLLEMHTYLFPDAKAVREIAAGNGTTL